VVTVSATVVVCVAAGPLPVTVIVYVPGAVEAPTASDRVDEPPAVTDDGLNDAAVPAGTPDADRDTVCAEPLVTAVEIVEPPFAP
jgi:hypothetical protein